MKKILVYGDSNVWGDNFFTGKRIPDEKQWCNILQKKLGKEFKVLQEGLPGRIAGCEEKEKAYKNGKETFLSTFRTCAPVDTIIIALGTNDLQIKYQKSSKKIVDDLLWYKEILESEYQDIDNKKKFFVNEQMPRIIYLLPANFDCDCEENPIFDKKSEEKRKEIQTIFKDLDEEVISIDDVTLFEDGIHFDYNTHELVAKIVKENL